TPGYRHVSKLISPGPRLTLDGTILKWYDIAPAAAPVPRDIGELARDGLREASKSGALGLSDGHGFVVLHRCGQGFYFLLISTWRNDNELWETTWAKDGDEDREFHPWPIEAAHRPTFCVWELGVVCHEQQAWSRFLRTRRDDAAIEDYLEASYAGPT